LKVFLRRGGNHTHEAIGAFCIFDLMLGKTFIILADSIDVEAVIMVVVVKRWLGDGMLEVAVVNKKVGCRRVLLEVKGVKSLLGR
jgi:hypothetical protein